MKIFQTSFSASNPSVALLGDDANEVPTDEILHVRIAAADLQVLHDIVCAHGFRGRHEQGVNLGHGARDAPLRAERTPLDQPNPSRAFSHSGSSLLTLSLKTENNERQVAFEISSVLGPEVAQGQRAALAKCCVDGVRIDILLPNPEPAFGKCRSLGITGSGGIFTHTPFSFAVADAVMQTAHAALPELDFVCLERVAAPVRRAGDLAFGILRLEFDIALLQPFTADHHALIGHPGADLMPVRTAGEVLLRIGTVELGDGTAQADLMMTVRPQEAGGGTCIGGDFVALSALVVGVKMKAALVDALEQHRAHGRCAIEAIGGEAHRIGRQLVLGRR